MLEINQIYLGDCLEVMKQIDDKSIDLILTDPPYLKNYSTGYKKNILRKSTKILNDKSYDYDSIFKEYLRILKDECHLYLFGCWQKNTYFFNLLVKYFKIKNKLIWVKNNWTAGDLFWTYGQSYEEIYFCTNGRKKLNGRRDRDCLFFNRVSGKEQLHLNQKPIELIEFLIKKSSKENELIFDSFLGSGTTAVAAKNTNRKFIGIELEEKYYEIAKKRLEGTL